MASIIVPVSSPAGTNPLTYEFTPPVDLADKAVSLAVLSWSVPYTWANLQGTQGAFSVTIGLETTDLTIPAGCWSVDDIALWLSDECAARDWIYVDPQTQERRDYVVIYPDLHVMRVTLRALGGLDISVDLSAGLGTTLGFGAGQMTLDPVTAEGVYESVTASGPAALTGEGVIYLCCDQLAANCSYVNGVSSNVADTKAVDLSPGFVLTKENTAPVFLPLYTGSRLARLTLSVVGARSGTALDLRGEGWDATICLRVVDVGRSQVDA